MRHANLRQVAIIVMLLLVASVTRAATKEYFLDEEIDFIRDAQGLSHRIPALLQLASIRLVALGMKDRSKEDKELEKRVAELRDEIDGKASSTPGVNPSINPQRKPTIGPGIPIPTGKPKPAPVDALHPYLDDVSRIELLRGYVEALDEATNDIDDAYRDKQEVRGVLEQFEKFCNTTIPLLRKFQSHNAAELEAIDDARSTTQEKLEAAQDAMKKIPKTEKSGKP